jgi:hypothetical protein
MPKSIGTIILRRDTRGVVLTLRSQKIESGLMLKSSFGIRSVHFGTRKRGYDISKGQGYGWDGRDYIRATRHGSDWRMRVPVRDDDPERKDRRFVKGNAYIRTHHNEIIYLDLRKWRFDPGAAGKRKGLIEIDIEDIPGGRSVR